jgi:exosortase H (IPTLxxWG-CTERM-specific)
MGNSKVKKARNNRKAQSTTLSLKIRSNWLHKNPVLVFIGLFAVQMIVFYCIYLPPYTQEKLITPIATFYAILSGMVLNLFGYDITLFGDTISSPQFSIAIKKGCDALEPMGLFIAGILAFPALFRKKIIGLLIGLLVIFFLNIVRIISLFITGIHNYALFEAMHIEIWQVIFILVAIGLWFLWLRWAVRKVRAT